MGWMFSSGWSTKSELVRHLTKKSEETLEDGRVRERATLAKCVRGNTLYLVSEAKLCERGRVVESERTLVVVLLGAQKDYGWGYKDMDESWGPCEATCPPKYFDLVGPPPNKYAADWRARCREYAARKARRPRLGEVWSLPNCRPKVVRITTERPLRGNHYYRLPKRILGERILTAAQKTAAVAGLVEAIDEGRAFDRLPILADALRDAGCDNEDVLGKLGGEDVASFELVKTALSLV